ncbi:hypothetical protein BH09PSE4_BH09PSE4_03040 [soil metagenome]
MRPLEWTAPHPALHDALLLTSANALRHGGQGLAALKELPVLAVGEATAKAARVAGFDVALTGSADAQSLLAVADGFHRILHLAGRDHTVRRGGAVTEVIAVYASDPIHASLSPAEGATVVLHSARAARRFAELTDSQGIDRGRIRLAALSATVAQAAGSGWEAIAIAAFPDDAALIAAAHALDD